MSQGHHLRIVNEEVPLPLRTEVSHMSLQHRINTNLRVLGLGMQNPVPHPELL